MTTTEKLKLMKEMDELNNARRKAHLETIGAYKSLEVYAKELLDVMDVLAKVYSVPRNELIEQMILMLQARVSSVPEQEG